MAQFILCDANLVRQRGVVASKKHKQRRIQPLYPQAWLSHTSIHI